MMYNIVFSTTRQWNPGDEFIVAGIRNILDTFDICYNPIIYNRNPNVRKLVSRSESKVRVLEREQHLVTSVNGICENSIKRWDDWSTVDLIIVAGTPEWENLRCEELYQAALEYKIPVAFTGVDHFDLNIISASLREVLKKRIYFSTRNIDMQLKLNKFFEGGERMQTTFLARLFCQQKAR